MRMLLILLLAGCPNDFTPRESCEGGAEAQCERMYACLTSAQLTAGGWPSTQAGCVTKLETDRGCAAATTSNICTGNGVYHPDDARECIDQINGLECSQLLDRTIDLKQAAPACGRVCRVE